MMSFCKKSVQSLFDLTTHKNNGTVVLQETSDHDLNHPSPAGGLSFNITLSCNTQFPVTNVMESAVAQPSPSSPTTTSVTARDPGGIGFMDELGGSVGGLMSCTESLGFESSDERSGDDDQFQNMNNDELYLKRTVPIVRSPKNEVKKKFPPPLSSLDGNGKPKFFLRHVRKNGRLELTEVKIHRPEFLCASRADGRLRLHLIRNSDEDDDVEEVPEDEAEELEEIEEDKGGGEKGGEWQFPVKNCDSDGIMRCHELASQQHHHHPNLHAWRQHCVTIS